ncbi:MAG: hypothetical protein Tsb005_01850 [Gammaproteobacteria bacterium]
MPHRFSIEYIFARKFTANYDQFKTYFAEFNQLLELTKMTVVTRLLNAVYERNKMEIKTIEYRIYSWFKCQQT